MTRDDLSVLAPADAGTVTLGEGAAAVAIAVRPLKVGQLPAFARAVRPLIDQITAIIDGGVTPAAVAELIEVHFDRVVDALCAATPATAEQVREATIEQALELVLAVLRANQDFLRGRLVAALRTAAQATTSPGAGQTPSQP